MCLDKEVDDSGDNLRILTIKNKGPKHFEFLQLRRKF